MPSTEYTQEEFEQRLLDLYGSDFAGLAALVEKMNRWLSRGDRVGEYINGELNPNSFWDRRYHALDPRVTLREEIADSQGSSRRYRLEGVYSGDEIKTGELLKRVKIERPAVAYIDAGYDINGNSRRGWAVYRDQKLIEFVRKDIGETYYKERLEELGADESWATGKIKVSDEVWEEVTNEDNWPVSSRKFSSHRAERLYGYAMQSFEDESVGDGEFGCSWIFRGEQTILHADSRGNVSARVFEDDHALDQEWNRVAEEWEQFCEEENAQDAEEEDEGA